MHVAIYLRKSRAEEFHDPVEQTLKRHREMLLEYAQQHNLTVEESDIYEEVVSGETLYERPKMLELLAEVEKGRYEGVLCIDIDRLGRGAMSEQGVILETLKRSNTRIITLRKTYDLANEVDEEYTEFETFMARRELKMIKRRMRRGVERTVQEGGFLAVPPFGYLSDQKGKRPTLKINEEEAKYVRLMFELYVNQGKGCQYIADALNQLGVKPHRAETFCRTSVRHLLKNPAFIGKIVWNRKQTVDAGGISQGRKKRIDRPPEEWTIVQGLHPPIIEEELFFKAQEIFAGKYHPSSYDGSTQNPLAGILRCDRCGALMQRKPLSNGRGATLLCPTRGCVSSTRLDRVEAGVLRLLRTEMESVLMERLRQSGGERDAPSLLEEIAVRRKKLVERQQTLYELLESGIYSPEVFLQRKTELDQKISRLETSSLEIQQKNGRADVSEDRSGQTLFTYYQNASASVKNQILKALIQEGTYDKRRGWGSEQFVVKILLKEGWWMGNGEGATSCSPHES